MIHLSYTAMDFFCNKSDILRKWFQEKRFLFGGLTYLETGRPKEAIRCFEKALSLEDRVDTRGFLKQAYEGMKD